MRRSGGPCGGTLLILHDPSNAADPSDPGVILGIAILMITAGLIACGYLRKNGDAKS